MFRLKTQASNKLILVTSILLLSGCKWFAQPVATDIRYIEVPRAIYPVCNLPVRDYNTIGERILWGEDVAEAYTSCIADVDTLIQYLEETRTK